MKWGRFFIIIAVAILLILVALNPVYLYDSMEEEVDRHQFVGLQDNSPADFAFLGYFMTENTIYMSTDEILRYDLYIDGELAEDCVNSCIRGINRINDDLFMDGSEMGGLENTGNWLKLDEDVEYVAIIPEFLPDDVSIDSSTEFEIIVFTTSYGLDSWLHSLILYVLTALVIFSPLIASIIGKFKNKDSMDTET